MQHYCTLFDSSFLPQGLALYRSLIRHAKDFKLWVLCMDEMTHRFLERKNFPCIQVLSLAEVENSRLLEVKVSRSRREYCWTLGSFLIGHVISHCAQGEFVTYLDADLYLRKDPQILLDKLEKQGKSVLLTRQDFPPEFLHYQDLNGKYCVQFMPFRNEPNALSILHWWQDRCIEWCYDRHEDGKFGDQKYLDSWPEKFADSVLVLNELGMAQGPWNASLHSLDNAIFYHFHALRLFEDGRMIFWNDYPMPPSHRKLYLEYQAELQRAVQEIDFKLPLSSYRSVYNLRSRLVNLFKTMRGRQAWSQIRMH